MLFALSILFGTGVGFALGLTGGGGSLLAVPLLVYGLAVEPRDAFAISLAAVGIIALFGLLPRLRAHEVEVGTGMLFAAAGVLGAPIGASLASILPEAMLLTLFSVLMLMIAIRMWKKAKIESENFYTANAPGSPGPACRRTSEGNLTLTSRCAALLALLGIATGVLSGLFGVGGGFIIVPALVLFSRMSIRRAVATSLLVIVLVSISGVVSHVAAGRDISLPVTALFVTGGILGIALGGKMGRRLDPVRLQKVFAGGIVAVAIFVAGRTLLI